MRDVQQSGKRFQSRLQNLQTFYQMEERERRQDWQARAVLSYYQQKIMSYVRPTSVEGNKFVAGFSIPSGDVVEIVFTFIDGMLLGDGSKLIEAFESHSNHGYFTRNPSMSKLQRLKSTPSS